MGALGYSYAIALGSGVALASLIDAEDLLWNYTRPRRIVPRSQPPNLYPVRTTLGSGRVRGDGAIDHSWEFTAIPVAAVDYLMSFLWAGGTVVSTAVTINTPRHELDEYFRANAYAILPVPGTDMEYIKQGVMRLTIRFSELVAL